MVPIKQKPPKATSEGFLLLILLLSVLLTLMSLLLVHHPAVGVFEPIQAEAGQ